MPAHAPQLYPVEREPQSAAPWIVVALAATMLLAAVAERLVHIPASLERRARALADGAGAAAVDVSVEGRDVTLGGELAADVDRTSLIDAIARTDGVRVVRDEMRVIDPLERARGARTRFLDELARLDLSAVAFEPGSASLVGGGDAALAALAALLRDAPDMRIRVSGHTDDTGRAEVNLRLSRERAAAVAAWLGAHGVERERVITQGYGSTQPIASNATEAGRARNRRIEISYID